MAFLIKRERSVHKNPYLDESQNDINDKNSFAMKPEEREEQEKSYSENAENG